VVLGDWLFEHMQENIRVVWKARVSQRISLSVGFLLGNQGWLKHVSHKGQIWSRRTYGVASIVQVARISIVDLGAD